METTNDKLVRWWCSLNAGIWPEDLATPPSQQRDEAAQWGAFCVVAALVDELGLTEQAEATWEQQWERDEVQVLLP